MSTALSKELALDLINSQEEFPVDFDKAWVWLGYTSKQRAKDKLTRNFQKGLDWVFSHVVLNSAEQGSQGGRPRENIGLTLDCFKCLAMMAGTQRGREIRQYFLDCEKQLKAFRTEKPETTQVCAIAYLTDAEVSSLLIARSIPPFLEILRNAVEDGGLGYLVANFALLERFVRAAAKLTEGLAVREDGRSVALKK
jgi:phage anti-repressor protein